MCITISVITYSTALGTGNNVDFDSTTQTTIITAGTNSSTVNVTVINDNIVEEDEMFTMYMSVSPSLGPSIITGAVTNVTATIVDSSSKFHYAKLFNVMINLIYYRI